MALTFEHGSSEHPRGHAVLYFRDPADRTRCMATYLIVLPITMDVAKYIPPLLAGRLPLGDAKPMGALPLPPIPEVVEDIDALLALAEARADDVVCGGTLAMHDLPGMMQAVANAAQEYYDRYEAAVERGASRAPQMSPEDTQGEMDVQDALYGLMSESDRITELTRLTGQIRYALQDERDPLVAQAVGDLERLGRHLHPKYRFEAFLAAARTGGQKGERLTELYITRCYRLARNEFGGLTELDSAIRDLEAGDDSASS